MLRIRRLIRRVTIAYIIPGAAVIASLGLIVMLKLTIMACFVAEEPCKADAWRGYVQALVSTLGFGIGIVYFWVESRRKREQAVMSQVTDILKSISEIRAELIEIAFPFDSLLQKNESLTSSEMEKWQKGDNWSKIEHSLGTIVNQMERLCLGVRFSVFDEDMTKELAGTLIVRSWEVVRPMVVKKRKDANWLNWGEHFEWLYRRWQRSASKEP